jgi:antitoxin HicB
MYVGAFVASLDKGHSSRSFDRTLLICYDGGMEKYTYTAHIEPCDEGGFVAFFPALPGCHTQGETLEEVIAMAKDALAGYLETLQAHGEVIPQERSSVKVSGFDLPLSVPARA